MKFHIAKLLFCLTLFCSCSEKAKKPNEIPSSGKINHLTIVMNDLLWNGEIGDSLRKKFATPVDGLTQEEPLFTINQYPIKVLDGTKTTNRNMVIIKKEERNLFELKENEFAYPQNVFHVSGNSTAEILLHIETHYQSIINISKQTDIVEVQKIIKKEVLDKKKLLKKFRTNIDIPVTYKYVIQRPNFVWLKKEMVSGNNSILVYTVPFKTLLKDDNLVKNIIAMRDSVSGIYVHSKVKNSKMITEASYAPYFSMINFDNKRAYETKGTWELKGDFMSGSFINYAIVDKRRKRFLVIEGFCYAPSAEKRDLMFELEAIIKSARLVK